MSPIIIDACCCAGGASMGYYRAGWTVRGNDIRPQPDYPFDFTQGDALQFIADNWRMADAVHISPPCQSSCALTKGTNRGRTYLDLIPAARELLQSLPIPWVIENVQGAAVRRDLTLCGEMFGLDVIRHRYFEVSGFDVMQPPHVRHRGRVAGWRQRRVFRRPVLRGVRRRRRQGDGRAVAAGDGHRLDPYRKALAEALPPAYTQLIGEQLIAQLSRRAA